MDLDYPNEHTLDFSGKNIEAICEVDEKGEPVQEQPLLSLYFTFYSESVNTISIKFYYSFTQTHQAVGDLLGLKDTKESIEFSQEHTHDLVIKSI